MADDEEESPWLKVGYYEILGVETTATPEEIKKAFRKRAMQCHPDKGGDQEEFKRVGEAKAVLMDPESRNFYDMYGEDGVAFLKGWKEAKPNQMLSKLGAGGICCFCCTNTICLLFLLLFPMLLCVKVADSTDWIWAFVFSPLFIIDAIVVALLCLWPLLPVSMARGDPLSSLKWDWLAQVLCLIVFQIFLCAKLDGTDMKWLLVLCPMYAFQGIGTSQAIWNCLPSQHAEASKLKKPGATCGYAVWILYNVLFQVLWWTLWVLLQMKLDKEIDISWWLVVMPAFLILVLWIFEATRSPVVASGDLDEKAYEQAIARWKGAVAVIIFVMIILAVCLAEGVSGFTMWVALAPLYVIGGIFVCALCVTSVALCQKEKDLEEQGDECDWSESDTPRDTDPLNPSPRGEDRV